MNQVLIEDDTDNAMMSISFNGECLFDGNYWDFDHSSDGLKKLLEQMGLAVTIEETTLEEISEEI